MEDKDHSGAQVVVIATAQNKQQLNKDLLQSRGVHVFEKILEIDSPGLVCVYMCEVHTLSFPFHGLLIVIAESDKNCTPLT